MFEILHQGDVIKIEGISAPVIVASKESFNQSGEIIGCPVINNASDSPLHIVVKIDGENSIVNCEKLKLLDLNVRGHKRISRLSSLDTMEVADAIQSIFDYIYA